MLFNELSIQQMIQIAKRPADRATIAELVAVIDAASDFTELPHPVKVNSKASVVHLRDLWMLVLHDVMADVPNMVMGVQKM